MTTSVCLFSKSLVRNEKTNSSIQRHHRRQNRFKPILYKLHQWLLDHEVMVLDEPGTMKVIDYSLRHWDYWESLWSQRSSHLKSSLVNKTNLPNDFGKIGEIQHGQFR